MISTIWQNRLVLKQNFFFDNFFPQEPLQRDLCCDWRPLWVETEETQWSNMTSPTRAPQETRCTFLFACHWLSGTPAHAYCPTHQCECGCVLLYIKEIWTEVKNRLGGRWGTMFNRLLFFFLFLFKLSLAQTQVLGQWEQAGVGGGCIRKAFYKFFRPGGWNWKPCGQTGAGLLGGWGVRPLKSNKTSTFSAATSTFLPTVEEGE